MREIGVGYNGSAEAEHALEFARGLAREHHCKLSAFEAVCIPAQHLAAPVWSDPGVIEDMVEDAREQIDAIDGVEPHAAYGLPAEELAVYSASLDLLVIGSRGYGPLGRLLHGSTAQKLARSARCPLLVLPRAGQTDPTTASAAPPKLDTPEPTS
jgi:nucleotide-binding universal stress UspA family protein